MNYLNPNLLQQKKASVSTKVYNAILIFFTVLMAIIVVANLFFFEGHPVEGPSMLNTICDGDKITVCKWKEPDRGDIVIIELDGKIVVKRVIALGGESVKIDKQGKVYINGEFLPEPYLDKSLVTFENREYDCVVPDGYVYYLGDNRSVSLDSRANGPTKEDNIIGVVSDYFLKIKDKPIYKYFLYYIFI